MTFYTHSQAKPSLARHCHLQYRYRPARLLPGCGGEIGLLGDSCQYNTAQERRRLLLSSSTDKKGGAGAALMPDFPAMGDTVFSSVRQ